MKVVKEETNGACKCPECDEEYNDECDDNEKWIECATIGTTFN